jgi:radical SAM/Cys-rich protein
MQDTRPLLLETDFPLIRRAPLHTLQVNLGYLCNLSCTHCHVNAGPQRTELMDLETIELVIELLDKRGIGTLDLTGGSPEMNPHFKYLVEQATSMGVTVMDRCNPTILGEPGYEDTAEFLAGHQVVVVASLPCYSEQNVDKQRGKGVFRESILGLLKLNELGYGKPDSGLILDLVYNPDDAVLPPSQDELKEDYKKQLRENHGIEFNDLYVLANMPISRFGARLIAKDQYVSYMSLLRNSFQQSNLNSVMCRNLISVNYQGYLFDCDFNQMLDLPMKALDKPRPHLQDLVAMDPADADFSEGCIAVGDHCYGCTAGQGSSCGGALAAG